jgi:hypothetical protein
MDRKAKAHPKREAIQATKAPGHIPYVKPMRDIEPAKPNKGGCDAKTKTQDSFSTKP